MRVTQIGEWLQRHQTNMIVVTLFCVVASGLIQCWIGDSVLLFLLCALCGTGVRLAVDQAAYGPSPLFDFGVVTAFYALSHAPQLLSSLTRSVCYVVLGILMLDLWRMRQGK